MAFIPASGPAAPLAQIASVVLHRPANPLSVGNVVTLAARFIDADGATVTPETVICRVRNGHASHVATYSHPDGLALTDGAYTVNQPVDTHGHWLYRFEAKGPAAADEFSFYVRPSRFD